MKTDNTKVDLEGIAKFTRWFKLQRGTYMQDSGSHCLAVWATRWKHGDPHARGLGSKTFALLFNLPYQSSFDIYFGNSDDGNATRAQATHMLEHLAKTGCVDWNVQPVHRRS